jgi:DNA polymerase delta subunit 1
MLIKHLSQDLRAANHLVAKYWSTAKSTASVNAPPLRILSFDIECICFPKRGPIIQIANAVTKTTGGKVERRIFTLNTCSPITGACVISYEHESDMLTAWADFVRELSPDIITGYNIQGFDFPYLQGRAKALNMKIEIDKKEENKKLVILDLLPVLRRNFPGLPSYKLDAVSRHFLDDCKGKVSYSIIGNLQNGSADTRRRLAISCLKDAVLPLKLIERLNIKI